MDGIRPDASMTPPEFLQLAGHPLRWRLLMELARSDRQVHELTALIGQPQNLISYHLGKLRAGRLVTARRSAADRRDAYYILDLTRCGDLLAATGAALYPALAGQSRADGSDAVSRSDGSDAVSRTDGSGAVSRAGVSGYLSRSGDGRPPGRRVLFLCTGNSARSQIAEAWLQHLSGGTVAAYSAGSHPKSLHPDAVRVMAEHGIDLSGRRAKHLGEFTGQRFTAVVTLCDRVREICPEFPGNLDPVHWSIPDPAGTGDGYPAFQRTAVELRTRVGQLLRRLAPTPILEVT